MLSGTIRVRFRKTGDLKFISHLDLMRFLTRALVRAKIPVAYTEGFNPHPKLTFGLPLSVGTESVCELMELRIEREMTQADFLAALNACLPEDLRADRAYIAPVGRKLSAIAWAEYEVRTDRSIDPDQYLQGSILVCKQTKSGEKVLTDPREIYELAANQGARRLRACILSIIPGDIVDEAIDACCDTLSNGNKRPLIDRLRELTDRFQTYYSVPLSAIERYFKYPLDSFTEMDGVALAGIYTALRDGTAKREDFFQLPKVAGAEDEPAPEKTGDAPKKGNKKQVSMDDL